MEFEIMLGFGEVGKTTFAKKRKGTFLGFDGFHPYGTLYKFNAAMEQIAARVNEKPRTRFVMDGYLSVVDDQICGADFEPLRSLLLHHDIKPIVVFSNADRIVEAVLKRGSPHCINRDFILWFYREIGNNFDLSNAEFYFFPTVKLFHLKGFEHGMSKLVY